MQRGQKCNLVAVLLEVLSGSNNYPLLERPLFERERGFVSEDRYRLLSRIDGFDDVPLAAGSGVRPRPVFKTRIHAQQQQQQQKL